MVKRLAITLMRSGVGRPRKHRLVLGGLGLRKMHQTVVRPDTPEIRGMIRKVPHLLRVEELQE
jgi:large subunit ribosomal protein L30